MIRRIVKMEFIPEQVDTFRQIFEQSKPVIMKMNGCIHVELLRDTRRPDVMFTLSDWYSEADLDAYRSSEFFLKTWKNTKRLFASKAEAWSLTVL
jgi:(4S)-4-hydroxy-5-phosphonooxypentane-2,3-dione isomerase